MKPEYQVIVDWLNKFPWEDWTNSGNVEELFNLSLDHELEKDYSDMVVGYIPTGERTMTITYRVKYDEKKA